MPQILDTNPRLYFHLQQQRLIELIRANNINEALDFAREELAPRGEENVCTQPKALHFFCLLSPVSNLLWHRICRSRRSWKSLSERWLCLPLTTARLAPPAIFFFLPKCVVLDSPHTHHHTTTSTLSPSHPPGYVHLVFDLLLMRLIISIQRQKTASELNAAILAAQCLERGMCHSQCRCHGYCISILKELSHHYRP
jgi:hypothetical protein